jgi:signal transduction histidine kinase
VGRSARRVLPHRRAAAVIALGAAVVVAYALIERPLVRAILYDGLTLVAAVVVLTARRGLDEQRTPWRLFGVGLTLFFVGDVTWDVYELGLHRFAPVPSLADVAFTGAYVFFIVGVVALLRRAGTPDLRGVVVDAGIVAAVAGAISWQPWLVRSAPSTATAFIAGVYPTGDIFVLALLVILTVPRLRAVSGWLLFLGMLLLGIADFAFLVGTVRGWYATGAWPDALFMLGPAVFAAAAVADDSARLVSPAPRLRYRLTSVGLVIAVLLTLPVYFIVASRWTGERTVSLAVAVPLVLLVAGRLLLLGARGASAEVRMLASHARLNTVVQHVGDAVLYVGTDGTVLEANAQAAALFNRDVSQLIGSNFSEFFDASNPQSWFRDRAGGEVMVSPVASRPRTLVHVRRQEVRRDGLRAGYTVFASNAASRVLTEAAASALGVYEDVAPVIERVGEALHDVVRYDTVSLFALDREAYREVVTFVASKSSFRAHRGRALFRGSLSPETVRRLAAESRIVVDDTHDGDDELVRLLRDVAHVRSAVVVPLQSGGEVHSVLCVGFFDPGAVARDVADIVAAVALPLSRAVSRMLVLEQERQVLRNIRELETAREEFLHLAAHEIRSPLGAVAVAAEAIRDRWDALSSDEGRDLAAGIASSVRRLSRLLNDVLENARAGTLGFHCTFDTIHDFDALIGTAATMSAHERPEDLRLELNVVAPVVGDRVRLEQVVHNLVVNACKYTPAGLPIEVAAWLEGDDVRLRVRDHGPGIDPLDAARVFERAARGAAECDDAGGSGFGLFIARGIVEAHGGQIWSDATPGGGATFEIDFPRDSVGATTRTRRSRT